MGVVYCPSPLETLDTLYRDGNLALNQFKSGFRTVQEIILINKQLLALPKTISGIKFFPHIIRHFYHQKICLILVKP